MQSGGPNTPPHPPTTRPIRPTRHTRPRRPVRPTTDSSHDSSGADVSEALRIYLAVVVAVPPGPRGVGDTDGNADERSAGWGRRDAAQGGSPI
ncbi:DUF7286 family protein [Halospeciosus flavus]